MLPSVSLRASFVDLRVTKQNHYTKSTKTGSLRVPSCLLRGPSCNQTKALHEEHEDWFPACAFVSPSWTFV